jgi:CRP-like cAMP-binding protein
MANLLTLTTAFPSRALAAGEALISAGDAGDQLFVLETGTLSVSRDGAVIATIAEPGALVGEMGVLLGVESSATVRAKTAATVRVIENALPFLERTPLVALHVATLACARLDATSRLLAEEMQGGHNENRGVLSRLFGTLSGPGR